MKSFPFPLFLVVRLAIFLLICFDATVVLSQENIRNIEEPGSFNKYLTPNTVDRWIFDGFANETIIAHVQTREFDAALQLVRDIDGEEKVLLEIDDEGSNGWLSYRLPADGEYKICVRGFETRGGGNYSLGLQQFKAKPIQFNQPTNGVFGHQNRAYFYFQADPSQHITVDVKGYSAGGWKVLDPQGKPVESWQRLIKFDTPGEYMVELHGHQGRPFEVTLHLAETLQWEDGEVSTGKILPRRAQIINISCREGDFRKIEFTASGSLVTQVVHAPSEVTKKKKRLSRRNSKPEIMFLPSCSKGPFIRHAVIWGRDDRYQVWLYSEKGATYRSSYADTSSKVDLGKANDGQLPLGDAKFYRVAVDPGQSMDIQADSKQFDTMIQLYDTHGNRVAYDDDGGQQLNSEVLYGSYKKDKLLLVISSVGNGGGGDFTLNVRAQEPQGFVVGKSYSDRMGGGGSQQWRVSAKKGQLLIFHAEGKTSRPTLTLKDSQGIDIAAGASTNHQPRAVLAHRFEQDGTYTLLLGLSNGGDYVLRGFDTN